MFGFSGASKKNVWRWVKGLRLWMGSGAHGESGVSVLAPVAVECPYENGSVTTPHLLTGGVTAWENAMITTYVIPRYF